MRQRTSMCWSPAPAAAPPPKLPPRWPACPRYWWPTRPVRRRPGRERRRAGAGAGVELLATSWRRPPPTARTCCRAWPPGWTWPRSRKSPRWIRRTPSSARSTPATPSPPCNRPTRSRSSPCAPPASTPPAQVARPPSKHRRRRRFRQVVLRLARTGQVRPSGTDRRQDHRLRRPRHGLGRQLQAAGAAGRQARRRHGRLARRRGRRLRAERLAGRPDRQDRRADSCTSRSVSRARSSTWPA
jgi:hypothetical protein